MDIICKEELLQAFQNAGCIPVCPLSMLKVYKLSCQRPLLGSLLWRSSWKDVIMLRSLVGHPVLKRPFLLTRSRAFVRSMSIILSGCLCFIHFCCSWRERIMSVVALLVHTAILGRPSLKVCGGSSWQNKVVHLLSNRGKRLPVARNFLGHLKTCRDAVDSRCFATDEGVQGCAELSSVGWLSGFSSTGRGLLASRVCCVKLLSLSYNVE